MLIYQYFYYEVFHFVLIAYNDAFAISTLSAVWRNI